MIKYLITLAYSKGSSYRKLLLLLAVLVILMPNDVFSPADTALYELAEEVIDGVQDAATQKQVTIKNEINGNFNLFADYAMISTVLRNLISNAIKFSFPGHSIFINATRVQDNTIISVQDEGTGIPQAVIEKLFRIDENITMLGTNKEKGTGLGLILCKEFVEKHGGKIWVESQEQYCENDHSGWSKFSFSIPENIIKTIKS